MDFEGSGNDRLEFQHIAGCNIIKYPPVFSINGQYIFCVHDTRINVYSTISYQLVRKLHGTQSPIVDFQLELKNDQILVACTQKGEILTWNWQTGELKTSNELQDTQCIVTNFKLLNVYGKNDLSDALLSVKEKRGGFKLLVVERTKDEIATKMCNLYVEEKKSLLMAVDTKNYPNLIICQGFCIFFVNYKTWEWRRYRNPLKVPVTAVQIHPTDECVATGDELGKIFLWRHFYDQGKLVTSLYHWHHTMVTSIAFTPSGSAFFSSGCEAVLVKWFIDEPFKREFLPRMVARIQHVVVNADNTQIAVCTADNGVQLLGTEKKIHANLQEFTYIPDDKTKQEKFPVGLHLNPRTNCLVLNGRTGSLQFYNTYTNNLLYNLEIVNENVLSMERTHILYDTRVVKAAFNIDWMATGELFNDQEHFIELRLKFWQYSEEKQTYILNTTIEWPHEGGFKAIAFSNEYQVDDLLCVTAGEDNIIKMWSLEDSDNIYKKGKTWFCVGTASYKDFHLTSLSFSQDGSLLAVGYANTLCIYNADNLQLKIALTAPPGLDGCVAKAQIKIPMKNVNGTKSDTMQKSERIMQMFINMLDANDDETFIKELRRKNGANPTSGDTAKLASVLNLDEQQKKLLFKQILQMPQINLYQKILLWQKLGITCKVALKMQKQFFQYLQRTIYRPYTINQIQLLHKLVYQINYKQRFKAKYRLQKFCKQKCHYDEIVTNNLLPLLAMLNIELNVVQKPKSTKLVKEHTAATAAAANDAKQTTVNNKSNKTTARKIKMTTNAATKTKTKINKNGKDDTVMPPVPALSDINHVQFAAGEYAHLVTVCTAHRILIWNLLTLRLQSFLKLSAQHVAFDPLTNLMAVVTENNELHIFQPNAPLPIYQRSNIPRLYGLAWVPRRYRKQCSINIDWQAQSTLYFLTRKQTILNLRSPNDKSDDVLPVVFENAVTPMLRYTTFGTMAAISNVDNTMELSKQQKSGPLILSNSEKMAVKDLLEMSAHTMPPMSLLCDNFIKSMLKSVDTTVKYTNNNNDNNELNDTARNEAAITNHQNNKMNGIHLNGDIEMNGHSYKHTDDDDDSNSEYELTGDNMKESQEQQTESIHKRSKFRKELFRRNEELKHNLQQQQQQQQHHQLQQHNIKVAGAPSCRTLMASADVDYKLSSLAQYRINFDF